MKTLITLSIFIVSFLFTSCYTQFATVKENDDYVVKRERTYQKYEKPDDSDDTYYEKEQDQSADDDTYYNDDDSEYVTEVEYHYSSRPVVYQYRFAHYDPWYDEYVYYNRPVTVISVNLGHNYYYDPFWVGFYCSPYDYYDPWFGWCGYSYESYYPYYYGHYYHDRFYGGYYPYGNYGHRGYRYNYDRYSRDNYASNWGRRPFTASKPGRLVSRPERPATPNTVVRPDRPIDMPVTKPVVSKPDRPTEPLTLERPHRPLKSSRDAKLTKKHIYTDQKPTEENRTYKRKYYNATNRIKSELNKGRTKLSPDRRRKPKESTSTERVSVTRPTKSTPVHKTDVRQKRSTVKSSRAPQKPVEKSYKPSPRPSRQQNVQRPKYSSRPKSNYKPSAPRKSYSPPRSSSPSRSSVRSTPSRSSSSGSSGRSSRSSSSSGRSSSGGGKRPR